MRKGTLYVFTGPSGAGKGTLLGRLREQDDRLYYSISATTRAPRPGGDRRRAVLLPHARGL